jgi:hypothetical protein
VHCVWIEVTWSGLRRERTKSLPFSFLFGFVGCDFAAPNLIDQDIFGTRLIVLPPELHRAHPTKHHEVARKPVVLPGLSDGRPIRAEQSYLSLETVDPGLSSGFSSFAKG